MTDKCKEHVHNDGRSVGFHRCTRKAVKDGYCKIHHPDMVEERRKKINEKWDIKSRIENIGWDIRGVKDECFDLVCKLAGENAEAAALVKRVEDLRAEKAKLSK